MEITEDKPMRCPYCGYECGRLSKEDKPSKLPPSQWKRGINSLKDDLRFDVSWGFGIKDKKLLDTVMDRVMETIDVWQMRMIAEKQEPSIPIKKIEEKIKEVESWRLIHNEAIFIDLLKSLLPKK
jgi:hypothetical protein